MPKDTRNTPDAAGRAPQSPAPPADTRPTFEQCMQRLEDIVQDMEEGELDLESLISRHEEGTRLVKICNGMLQDAQRRIAIIEETDSGVELKPFDADGASVGSEPLSASTRARTKSRDSQAAGSDEALPEAIGHDDRRLL